MPLFCFLRLAPLALLLLAATASADPLWVAAGCAGRRLASTDAQKWEHEAQWPKALPGSAWRAIAFGHGLFLLAGGAAGEARAATSPDGQTWREWPASPGGEIATVTFGRGRFVAIRSGNGELLWSTAESTAFTPGERLPWTGEIHPLAAAFGDTEAGFCFAVLGEADLPGEGEHLPWRAVSVDGTHWEWSALRTPPARAVAAGAGIFVLAGPGGLIETSHDGQTWTSRDSGTTEDFVALHWSGTQFLASGAHLFTSPDGMTWKAEGVALPRPLLWAGQGSALSSDWAGRLTRSVDFRTWSPVTPPSPAPLLTVGFREK